MDDQVALTLVQQADYRFEVRFDKAQLPVLVTDEPPPLGGDAGPNPSRLLVAAVANCLTASLLFALRKFKNEPGPMRTDASATLGRNEAGRLRVTGIAVTIHLGLPQAALKMAGRVLAQFEEFCVVTQSVRSAVPVTVAVLDAEGRPVLAEPAA